MNHHFISVNMSMEQGVDFSLFLKRMARKRKLVYEDDEEEMYFKISDGNEDVIPLLLEATVEIVNNSKHANHPRIPNRNRSDRCTNKSISLTIFSSKRGSFIKYIDDSTTYYLMK